MKNRFELFFVLLQVPIDFLMLLLAGISAYYLRIGTFVTDIIPLIYTLPVSQYMRYVVIVSLGWLVIFALTGLYKIKPQKKFWDEVIKVFLACTAGVMAIIIAIFLKRELFSSRFIILAAWIISILYVTFGRILIISIQRQFYKLGIGIHKAIIIGNDKNTYNLINAFKHQPKIGIRITKHFLDFSEHTEEEIEKILLSEKINEIIQGDPGMPRKTTAKLAKFADEHHLAFKYAADLLGTKISNIDINTIAGSLMFEIKKTPLEGWGRIYKRIFDIIFSIIFIVLTSPVMLVTAIAIKLDSNGPILFSRKDDGSKLRRVGQHGRLFHYFKFRSMKPKSDNLRYSKEFQKQDLRQGSPLVKIKDDPRITRVGKFIRRYSIDELPEFFLVLKGDMSLVGPRPHLPEEVEKYQKHHKKILSIKPGITGLAQISGRSDLEFEEEVRLDNYYIENWSLLLDIYIIFKTPLVLIKNRKAL